MPTPIQDNEIPDAGINQKDIPNTKGIQKNNQPTQNDGNNIDEYAYMLQNLKEQVKYEIKEEITNTITRKSNSLMSVDPATATALAAVASSISGAVSQVQPIEMGQGQPAEEESGDEQIDPMQGKPMKAEPQQPGAMPQVGEAPGKMSTQPGQKTAEDVKNFIFDSTVNFLKRQNYFELNKEAGDDAKDDLAETVGYIDYGANIYAYDNGLDFTDTNTWGLLEELISDGTLYNTGYNEINN